MAQTRVRDHQIGRAIQPCISLSLTSCKQATMPSLSNVTPASLEEEGPRNVDEIEKLWKYPLTNIQVTKERKLFGGGRGPWTLRDIVTATTYVVLHALCLFAPFTFEWNTVIVAFILTVVTGMGVTLSYHRNLAHRSFKLPKWLEYFWAYCGVHALQGSPMRWVSIHRTHHMYADKEGDPHSPLEGLWFSHINWNFDTRYTENKKGGIYKNVGDLQKQTFYRFIEKTYLAHPIALATILYAYGGFPWVVWCMGVRLILTYHVTFLINSALHIWGSRTYNTSDNSHNNWLLAILAFGEGWHNNHHAFEFSARQGLEWYQIDTTWYIIKLLDTLGLVKDLKLPTDAQKKAMLKR